MAAGIIEEHPRRRPAQPGGRPLDPDRPAPDAAGAEPGAAPASEPAPGEAEPGAAPASNGEAAGAGPASDAAPGIREQIRRTRDAIVGLGRAHIDLARAEAGEIGGEIKRAAALGGVAIACLLFLAFFLPVGLLLFVGEWLFGSIGWGLLHGTELLIAVAVLAGLLAIRARGLGRATAVAALTGIVLAVLLGSGVLNALWRSVGDAFVVGDPGWRPLAIGMIVVGLIGAVVGGILGARATGRRGATGGIVAGLVIGALAGGFSAITFGWRVGAALGVTIGLAAWPILMGVAVARQGVDAETLKARFWPKATIDTVKETIEWAKSRTPLGPTS